jgi:hypothetical protein
MKTLTNFWNHQRDAIISTLIGMAAFTLYLRTLAPSVVFIFDDTLEMQYVVPRLGILHPTGYPLYTLLGKLFTLVVPLNDVALRLNLFSAVCAALAVAFVYLVAHQLVQHRFAALIAALTFAVGETFWAQAVVAEVYALQMLLVALILWFALDYATRPTPRHLYLLALALGFGLTHHRLIVLLFPAIVLYVFLVNRTLHDFKTLARAALFFCAPLLLYLYLPLRASVGSADGTYENTLAGFFNWVMASQYKAFFENPLHVQRDAAYYWTMFQNQFTLAGLVLVTLGGVAILRKPHQALFLMVALIAEAGFAFNYRTADVEVHFLTTFLLLALWLAIGIDVLGRATTSFALRFTFFILALLIPLYLLMNNFATNDLSAKWDVYDYGRDILSQPLESNATLIGITGEMTLIRYFQENAHLRPEVETLAADKEDERLAAIDHALKQNRAVYLTRPLKGAAEKYSLVSLGPLIRVYPQPLTAVQPDNSFDANFGTAKLIGYAIQTLEQHAENGRTLRVTLYWRVEDKIETDALVSVKVLSDQRVFGQSDHRPVRDAYPTTAWRPGEIVADTYDVPISFGVTPSEYTIHVTMYDAITNEILGQANVSKVSLTADVHPPRREVWNIARTVDADFGVLALAGYSLNTNAPIRPGDALPLTLLWRAGWQKLPDNLMMRVWLEDANGKQITSREMLLSIGYPPFEWQPNIFVRDFPVVRLPANLADGTFTVKLAIAHQNELRGSTLLPFVPTIVDLGKIEIKNRARMMDAPIIPRALEATFDRKIKLLGYEWKNESAQLTLYWRALALMDTPYTVFVHLLDAQNRVIAYGDAEPGNGTLPTTGWIENEYIVDPHTLALGETAPGTYSIEIGVYDPVTGTRLKTSDGQDRVLIEPVMVWTLAR